MSSSDFLLRTGVSAIVIATVLAGGASAQQASRPDGASTAASDGQLAEIIVTAQKKEENVQKVPIAVTVLSGEAVSALHEDTLLGLKGETPDFQVNTFVNMPMTAVVSIRGIGAFEPEPYEGSPVSIVEDGVPSYFTSGALVEAFDISGIDVLRGPQGTLFGANTTGGVVNVTSNQPGKTFDGNAEFTYGNYNRVDGDAAVDLPLTDKLFARVAFLHKAMDGWVVDASGGPNLGATDHTGLRGILEFDATDDLTISLLGEYDRERDGMAYIANGAYPGEVLYVPPGVSGMYPSVCPFRNSPCVAPNTYVSADSGPPNFSNNDIYRTALTINWKNSPLGDLTSITGYKHVMYAVWNDEDATPLYLYNAYIQAGLWQASEELRTNVKVNDRLNFTAGVFGNMDHYALFENVDQRFIGPGNLAYNDQDQRNWSGSAFGQLYFNVTDKLQLLAGIRYTHELTSMLASNLEGVVPSNVIVNDGDRVLYGLTLPPGTALYDAVTPPRATRTWNNEGWKLGLTYAITDDVNTYATYSHGFKSGGFVGRLGIPTDIGPFEPEKVDTYEIGAKTDFLSKRLRTNLAIFYNNYIDLQVDESYNVFLPNGTYVTGSTVLNAPKAITKGVELQADALLGGGFSLAANTAYLSAKYQDFPYLLAGTTQEANLAGYTLQDAPRWTANVAPQYQFALGNGTATTRVSYSYTAKKYLYNLQDTPRSTIQPEEFFDGSFDWAPDGKNWSIGAWARNIANRHYIAYMYDAPGFDGIGAYDRPREYGMTLRFKWLSTGPSAIGTSRELRMEDILYCPATTPPDDMNLSDQQRMTDKTDRDRGYFFRYPSRSTRFKILPAPLRSRLDVKSIDFGILYRTTRSLRKTSRAA